jgi:pimeloyl-ACP methyl ester carboxylesterase/class 3 adenylate cyclase
MPANYAFGPFRLDVQGETLFRGTEPIALSRRAVVLLRVLIDCAGAPVPKDALIEAAWPGLAVEESNLTVHIAALRRVFREELGGERWIETLPRRGYRFVGPMLAKDQNDALTSTAGVHEIRYAKSGDIHIAYQVMGNGPIDLVFVPGFISHLELNLENPWWSPIFWRLASFCRLIRFDKRGTGLSDRVGFMPTLEERMDDVRAVMDAVGLKRAALLGVSEGGPMSILFSATYPDRASALILYGTMARTAWAPDYPWGRPASQLAAWLKEVEEKWGDPQSVERTAPSLAGNEEYKRWVGRTQRASASPGAAAALIRMNNEIDVRHVLSAITVPTLVLHRTGDRSLNVNNGRYLAQHIQGAKYVELSGDDHLPWVGDMDTLCKEIEAFLMGMQSAPDPDRVLATALFTDIVDAAARAAEIGKRKWKELLHEYHSMVRGQLERYRGREIETAGDGFFATFDGPARAVRCGRSIADAVKGLNIQIRAGVHTGECEVIGKELSGIAVQIAARIMALAAPDEVLVSSTVRDLVVGSGLRFQGRGVYALEGIPGEWNLLAAT